MKYYRFARISIQEQISFAKRLSILLRAHVPVLEALAMIRDQTKDPRTRAIYRELYSLLERGVRFSDALQSLHVFDRFLINMVRAGEYSGTLLENCTYAAEEMRRRHALTRSILGALTYPGVITCATIGMTLAITIYIFPKIEPIFRSFHHALPLSTRIVLWLSDTIMHAWWMIILATFGAVALIYILWRIERTRRRIEEILLRTPVVATLLRAYALANLSRTTGLLLSGGIQLVEALSIAASSAYFNTYRIALKRGASVVEHGRTLTAALGEYPHLFTPLFLQILMAGERSGDLSGSLLYLAELYEEELSDRTERMTELLEPILMIFMGCLVGFLAISIITPIYGITQNLSGYH